MKSILLLAVLLFALHAAAQQPEASYEGQSVGSVNVVTDPSIDSESMRALLVQKAGQPYSRQNVQATVDALNGTHLFREVDVQVKPNANGLQVLFVAEPAYYIGVIQFKGAGKAFPYARLLETINIPDQEPFQKGNLDPSNERLVHFLQRNGFFQAQSQPEVAYDESHGLANVTFVVELGKRAKIGRVFIEGPPPDESARLSSTTRSFTSRFIGASLRPGATYSQERIQAATQNLKRYLAKHDRLVSKVRFDNPDYHPETNRADLHIKIDEGPLVSIQISGARLSVIPFMSARQERKLLPVFEEGQVDRDLVEEGRRNLVSYFQAKGYFEVEVRTSFQRNPDKISIVYQIDKKKKYKVESVAFRGNNHVKEDDLSSAIAVEKHHLFSRGKYSNTLLTKSVQTIKAIYVNKGFEDVSVTPRVIGEERKVGVTFEIVEGAQTKVADVIFDGNKVFGEEALAPPGGFKLRPGSAFSPTAMSKDRGHILATYLDHGYLTATVKTNIQRRTDDSHMVDVVYHITEGQEVRIKEVALLGEERTRPGFILKTANLAPETPLSQGKLLQSESELYNLGIFDWASVGPRKPITDQTDEEAVIKVHEAPRNTISYGFGLEVARRGGSAPSGTIAVPGLPIIGTNGVTVEPSEATFVSPRGTFQFTRRNLRGLGETGAVSLALSRLDQRILTTYTDPQFRGLKWSSLLSLSAERNTENSLFAAQLENATFQLERPITHSKTTIAQLRYSFQKTDLSDLLVPELVLPADRHVRISTFSGTLIRDTRDKPLDAHRGMYQSLDLGITGKAIGASVNFGRLFAQSAYYKDVGHGIVWANSVRLGLERAYGDSDVPTSERFFSGGGTTLRGFPINGAGPQRIVPFCGNPNDPSTCANITVPVGGTQLFVFNSEGRFPLPIVKNLGFVLFYDGGNVYNKINLQNFADNFSNTVGFGIRYSTPVGPIRFDVGQNLNPVPGFRATQFFITIGQAF